MSLINITSQGGNIGRFWWKNSSESGVFMQGRQPETILRPGRIGWREKWPDWSQAWPPPPWGAGDPSDDHWRDFAAFEKWFESQLEQRALDKFDFNITERIELYDLMSNIFLSGIQAGRNPWAWAQQAEAINVADTTEESQQCKNMF